jgi:hypothetical protein
LFSPILANALHPQSGRGPKGFSGRPALGILFVAIVANAIWLVKVSREVGSLPVTPPWYRLKLKLPVQAGRASCAGRTGNMMTMSWRMIFDFMLLALRLQTRLWGDEAAGPARAPPLVPMLRHLECSLTNTSLVNGYNRLVCGHCTPGSTQGIRTLERSIINNYETFIWWRDIHAAIEDSNTARVRA